VPDTALLRWAQENDVVVIHLVRQNILRNLISKALLTRDQDEHQGNAHVRADDPQMANNIMKGQRKNASLPFYNNSRQIALPYPRNATWDDETALDRLGHRIVFDLKDILHWRKLLLEYVMKLNTVNVADGLVKRVLLH